MTRKQKRLWLVGLVLAGTGLGTALVLSAIGDGVSFFYSPSDLTAEPPAPGRNIRIGGLVEEGSVTLAADGVTLAFAVTDTAERIPVSYRGPVPDLFREGQGVVAEGRIGADGVFVADTLLAKHDETYMPPEVADALERAGGGQHQTRSLVDGGT